MCRKHGTIISSVPATPGLNILAVNGHSSVELARKKGQERESVPRGRIFQLSDFSPGLYWPHCYTLCDKSGE